MRLLHVSCSPRGSLAESYRLSLQIIDHLRERQPGAIVVSRVLDGNTMPPIDENYAVALGSADLSAEDISDEGSLARSEELIRELESADCIVISTPMHNFTVPAPLKAWIDHIVRVRRTFHVTPAGKVGTLADRPVFIAVSSGGQYSGKNARQPDFLTPYLTTIFGTIGLHDVTFFAVEGTAFGPDAVMAARAAADQQIAAYFSAFSFDARPSQQRQAS